MNVEWAKLKAVAQHLNCSELKAKEQLDAGTVFVYTLEEAKKIRIFLNRFNVRQTHEVKVTFNENDYIIIQER